MSITCARCGSGAAIPLIARTLRAKYPCPPEFVGATPTVRRWVNYARLLWSWHHRDLTLPSYPARLCTSDRQRATATEQQHICFECPALLDWHDFVGFRTFGGRAEDWVPPHDSNVRYNYFWQRKRHHESAASGGAPQSCDPKRSRVTTAMKDSRTLRR